jgi:hypothetical protein
MTYSSLSDDYHLIDAEKYPPEYEPDGPSDEEIHYDESRKGPRDERNRERKDQWRDMAFRCAGVRLNEGLAQRSGTRACIVLYLRTDIVAAPRTCNATDKVHLVLATASLLLDSR